MNMIHLVPPETFTRTSVELKRLCASNVSCTNPSFTRTSVELKLFRYLEVYQAVSTFIRTSVELKQAF